MKLLPTPLRFLCTFLILCVCASAQSGISIQPATGGLGFITRPYRAGTVPSIRLENSSRFGSLIRAGNLYLTAQDVVALAIENNIDVEIQRYGPLLQKEVLLRAQAGQALRSVGLPVAAGPQSVSLQGISANTTSTLSAAPASAPAAELSLSWVRRFPRSTRPLSVSPVSPTPRLLRAILWPPEFPPWS